MSQRASADLGQEIAEEFKAMFVKAVRPNNDSLMRPLEASENIFAVRQAIERILGCVSDPETCNVLTMEERLEIPYQVARIAEVMLKNKSGILNEFDADNLQDIRSYALSCMGLPEEAHDLPAAVASPLHVKAAMRNVTYAVLELYDMQSVGVFATAIDGVRNKEFTSFGQRDTGRENYHRNLGAEAAWQVIQDRTQEGRRSLFIEKILGDTLGYPRGNGYTPPSAEDFAAHIPPMPPSGMTAAEALDLSRILKEYGMSEPPPRTPSTDANTRPGARQEEPVI